MVFKFVAALVVDLLSQIESTDDLLINPFAARTTEFQKIKFKRSFSILTQFSGASLFGV